MFISIKIGIWLPNPILKKSPHSERSLAVNRTYPKVEIKDNFCREEDLSRDLDKVKDRFYLEEELAEW